MESRYEGALWRFNREHDLARLSVQFPNEPEDNLNDILESVYVLLHLEGNDYPTARQIQIIRNWDPTKSRAQLGEPDVRSDDDSQRPAPDQLDDPVRKELDAYHNNAVRNDSQLNILRSSESNPWSESDQQSGSQSSDSDSDSDSDSQSSSDSDQHSQTFAMPNGGSKVNWACAAAKCKFVYSQHDSCRRHIKRCRKRTDDEMKLDLKPLETESAANKDRKKADKKSRKDLSDNDEEEEESETQDNKAKSWKAKGKEVAKATTAGPRHFFDLSSSEEDKKGTGKKEKLGQPDPDATDIESGKDFCKLLKAPFLFTLDHPPYVLSSLTTGRRPEPPRAEDVTADRQAVGIVKLGRDAGLIVYLTVRPIIALNRTFPAIALISEDNTSLHEVNVWFLKEWKEVEDRDNWYFTAKASWKLAWASRLDDYANAVKKWDTDRFELEAKTAVLIAFYGGGRFLDPTAGDKIKRFDSSGKVTADVTRLKKALPKFVDCLRLQQEGKATEGVRSGSLKSKSQEDTPRKRMKVESF
ncbi:MAG: hypothetical protein M1833_003037 [Piccolia ochrophora]|nr:MAG: hypothetical protein M1833_003037 [Piccolia ochrophora]